MKKLFFYSIFHRNNKQIGTVNLEAKGPSLTQRFIDTYKQVSEQYKASQASEEQLYKEAIEILNRSREVRTPKETEEEEGESVSLSVAFKEAQSKQKKSSSISVKDIFKM